MERHPRGWGGDKPDWGAEFVRQGGDRFIDGQRQPGATGKHTVRHRRNKYPEGIASSMNYMSVFPDRSGRRLDAEQAGQ